VSIHQESSRFRDRMRNYSTMARELVWLESFSFTAWGCKECNWLIPGVRHTDSGKPPARVQEAFDRHECAKFPRQPSGGKRKAKQE